MSNVIQIAPSPESMTTRQIAEITGKRHDNVVRDLKETFEEVGIDLLRFEGSYLSEQNKPLTEYVLPKRECLLLTSRYSAKQRLAIIDRWIALEKTPQLDIPTTFAEALRIAADQAEQIEQQQAQILEYAPKAAFHDQVVIAEDAISVGAAAKIIGTGRTRLLAFLRKIGWVTRKNEPYQARIESGHMDVKLGEWEHPKQGLQRSVTPLITGKGLAALQQLYESAA